MAKQSPKQDADAPYTVASLARLVVSEQACELANRARGWVGICPGEVTPTGGAGGRGQAIEDMRSVVAQANLLLEWTVVYERAGGTSWADIADVLGISEDEAQARYGAAEQRFGEELAEPEAVSGDGTSYVRLHPAAHQPDAAARDLDKWVVDRREFGDVDADDPTPVSGQLARMDETTELWALSARRTALLRRDGAPPAGLLLPLAEREAVLWERLSKSGGRTSRKHARTWAASAHARADELRKAAAEDAATKGDAG